MKRLILILPLILLAGCDQLKERMGMHDPAKLEAEGKAVGAACRNAGLGLEDCFSQNEGTGKAAIYAGWKEMNEYMAKNNMQVIQPMAAQPAAAPAAAPATTAAPAAPAPAAPQTAEKPAAPAAAKADAKPSGGH